MEIKKLLDNKFEVVLHISDLEKFHIEFSQFMSKKIEEFDFFSDILNNIEKFSNLSLNNKKIIFETFFIDNSYFLIEIYIVGFLSLNGNFLPKEGNVIQVSQIASMIFRFSSFDSLCDFSNYLLKIKNSKIIFNFIDFICYKNNYYLIIKDSIFFTDLLDSVCLQVSEFAELISYSNILVKKLQEFGCNINFKI